MKLFSLVVGCVMTMQAQTAWDKLVDRYFDEAVFPYNPSFATQAGFHQYDTRLEDFSQETLKQQAAALRRFGKEFTAFAGEQPDRAFVVANIQSTLLAIETLRMWEKNPDAYSSTASNAAFAIMSRKFAAPEARLRSLIAREKLMPGLLTEARTNLKNPPRIYTEVALEQIAGIIGFFQKDVPLAFRDVKDPNTPRRLPSRESGRYSRIASLRSLAPP